MYKLYINKKVYFMIFNYNFTINYLMNYNKIYMIHHS